MIPLLSLMRSAPLRARGMSKIAKKAGLSRESLYKALSKEGNPEFGTIIRVMHALGLKFSVMESVQCEG